MPVEAEDIPEEEGVADGGSGEERANMVGGKVEDGEVFGGKGWVSGLRMALRLSERE